MAKTKGLPHVLDLIGVVLEEDDPYKPPQVTINPLPFILFSSTFSF